MDKTENSKQAFEKLYEAREKLAEAYSQLISEGASAAVAQKLCNEYIERAFDSIDKEVD